MARIARGFWYILALAALALPWQGAAAADGETIAFIRHGEKPEAGLGQLNCQGLNRALALPPVIARTLGRPDALFAPDPAHRKDDDGIPYDYIRPLATIEPTAISLGMPVHADLGVDDIAGLQIALEQSALRQAVVLVSWEHHQIETIARNLLAAHGASPEQVPKWQYDDYDSIYIVRLAWTGATAAATFERRAEGLDHQPTACPN